MLLQGFWLVAAGISIVFAFLVLLVGLMRLSAAFFEAQAHRFPEATPDTIPAGHSGDEEDMAVVLALAEAMHRGQRV